MTKGRVLQEFLPEMIRMVNGERERGSPGHRAAGLQGQKATIECQCHVRDPGGAKHPCFLFSGLC